jgi:hypothetical protein
MSACATLLILPETMLAPSVPSVSRQLHACSFHHSRMYKTVHFMAYNKEQLMTIIINRLEGSSVVHNMAMQLVASKVRSLCCHASRWQAG